LVAARRQRLRPAEPAAGSSTGAPAGDIVVMAKVLAPYGVNGWIKARPFSEATDALLGYGRWWLREAGSADWREVLPRDRRMHSGLVLAQLATIDSREAALALRGAEIGVPRAAMPVLDDDAVYWSDLIGLEVVNRAGVALGKVVEVQEFGAHPVLRVAPEPVEARPERLIPLVAAHVDGIDLAARRIDVDWQPDY
jgi:16S rRNA processing protein RimM